MLRTENEEPNREPSYDLRGPWQTQVGRDSTIIQRSDFWNNFPRLTPVPFETEGRKIDEAQSIGKEISDRVATGQAPIPKQIPRQIEESSIPRGISSEPRQINPEIVTAIGREQNPRPSQPSGGIQPISLNNFEGNGLSLDISDGDQLSVEDLARGQGIASGIPASLEDTAHGFSSDSNSLVDAASDLRASSGLSVVGETLDDNTNLADDPSDDLEEGLRSDFAREIDESREEQDTISSNFA